MSFTIFILLRAHSLLSAHPRWAHNTLIMVNTVLLAGDVVTNYVNRTCALRLNSFLHFKSYFKHF